MGLLSKIFGGRDYVAFDELKRKYRKMPIAELASFQKSYKKEDWSSEVKKAIEEVFEERREELENIGEKASDFLIQKTAQVVATRICEFSINAGEVISGQLGKGDVKDIKDETVIWKLVIEMEFVLLYLTDRKLSAFLDDQRRQKFINILVEDVGRDTIDTALLGSNNNEVDELMKGYFDQLTKRSEQYFKIKNVILEDGDVTEGTLLWEFGKKVAIIIDSSEISNVAERCRNLVLAVWKELNLDDIFTKLKDIHTII